jgi:hypothetical protein
MPLMRMRHLKTFLPPPTYLSLHLKRQMKPNVKKNWRLRCHLYPKRRHLKTFQPLPMHLSLHLLLHLLARQLLLQSQSSNLFAPVCYGFAPVCTCLLRVCTCLHVFALELDPNCGHRPTKKWPNEFACVDASLSGTYRRYNDDKWRFWDPADSRLGKEVDKWYQKFLEEGRLQLWCNNNTIKPPLGCVTNLMCMKEAT